MHSTTLLSLLGVGASLTLAQTTTQILYVPGLDEEPLVASVLGADATATTYAIQCAPPTSSDAGDCGLEGIVTLTEGPSTAAYTFPAEVDAAGTLAFTGYMDCSLYGTTSAVCIESFGGTEANFPGMSTETYIGTSQPYMPVVVTGAAAVSTPGPVATSTTTSSTGVSSTSASAATKTTSSSGITKTSSGSVSAVTGTGTSTSTAGGAFMTADSNWVLGGGAAAAAAAALAFVV